MTRAYIPSFFCGWLSPCPLVNGILQAIRDVGMACTRRTKTLVSTCVILSGMTNIVCLLYVGWVTNYIANVYIKVPMPIPEKKLGDKKGDTLRIIERLDRLENVVNQHIQGKVISVMKATCYCSLTYLPASIMLHSNCIEEQVTSILIPLLVKGTLWICNWLKMCSCLLIW